MKQQAEQVFKELDFYIPLNKVVKDCSIGEQQMIEIAKAMMMTKAQIIIMDEPTATLTDKEIRRLFDMIHNLKAKDVSFVYISHRMAEIFEISDEITVMRDGVSVMYDETTNLTYNQIVKAMVGRIR